jgi:hypothetical protein
MFAMAMRASFANQFLRRNVTLLTSLAMLAGTVHAQEDSTARALDLPTSKQLMMAAPGNPL